MAIHMDVYILSEPRLGHITIRVPTETNPNHLRGLMLSRGIEIPSGRTENLNPILGDIYR